MYSIKHFTVAAMLVFALAAPSHAGILHQSPVSMARIASYPVRYPVKSVAKTAGAIGKSIAAVARFVF